MREGCGTLTELTYLWKSLTPYCRWCLVEEAYRMKQNIENGYSILTEMPSQDETLALRILPEEDIPTFEETLEVWNKKQAERNNGI